MQTDAPCDFAPRSRTSERSRLRRYAVGTAPRPEAVGRGSGDLERDLVISRGIW